MVITRKKFTSLLFPEQRKMVCNICGKVFPTLDYLNRHKLMHQPPTLKCPRCDKHFRWKTNVMQHLRGVHFPPLYECQICNERFPHRQVVRSHLSHTHSIDQSQISNFIIADKKVQNAILAELRVIKG